MEPTDIHPVHHHSSGRSWLDIVMALAAMFVSVTSLIVALHHGRTMEKLVQANSLPNIEMEANVDDTGHDNAFTLDLVVANTGVGPARIETLQLSDGETRLVTAEQVLQDLKARGGAAALSAQPGGSSVVGALIGAGRERHLLTLRMDRASWALPAIRFAQGFQSRVCYCSVFDECYVTDSRIRDGRAAHVQACPAIEDGFSDTSMEALIAAQLGTKAAAAHRK